MLLGGLVVPDGGGEGEEALQYAGADTGSGAAAVSFEIELALEGLVDRFDDLAECFEVAASGAWWFRFQVGSDQGDPGLVEFGLERCTAVSRSSVVAPARAYAIGSPEGVVMRCRRSPQNQRECDAQYP